MENKEEEFFVPRRRLSLEERIQLKKKRRRKVIRMRMFFVGSIFLFVLFLFFLIGILFQPPEMSKAVKNKPDMTEELLTVNEFSRPGEELKKVKNIFVHYTANPGTSAEQNRSYFENLGTTGETSASAHFIIGYDGEIIQCLPLEEIGYAVKQRNYNSISIECCYKDESGYFTQATYTSLLHLTAWLMGEYDLTPEDVLRHYDEGGKSCPKYYVENPEGWNQFKIDLENYIEMFGKSVKK